MTDVQPIPVYRPTFLTDGGEFRGSLIESPANIFYQKVNASRATVNRLQFQWRSVSDNLLLSPTVMLRMKLKITCRQVWDQITSAISIHVSRVPMPAQMPRFTYRQGKGAQTPVQNTMSRV